MKANTMRTFFAAVAVGAACISGTVLADGEGHKRTYEITVTNLTRGQSFTPILAASHRPDSHPFFSVGEPASDAFAALAEDGNTGPLNTLLEENPRVRHTSTSSGLLDPGQSVSIKIKARSGRDRVSMAAMLIPTNDAFFAFQNLPLPRGRHSIIEYGPAYDAGSEPNDELCINIPGPVCGGTGASPGAGGEGNVHIHAGIHGIGDLSPAEYDWRNPVARVVIKRVD